MLLGKVTIILAVLVGCIKVIGPYLIFRCISPGLSPEGSADVVGEFDYGYFCISGPGNRTSHRVSAEKEAIWSQQTSYLQHHDKEHPRARSLSAHHHLHTAFCWYGLSSSVHQGFCMLMALIVHIFSLL